jgi:phenylacetate-CoA ligase
MGLAERVYAAAPIWLQDALISAYGARLRLLRYGAGHRKELEGLLRSQWLSADELRELQELAWARVRRVAGTVPMYGDLWRGGVPPTDLGRLSELPVLTKDTLRASGRKAVAEAALDRRLVEIHTGGTTGSPLTVYCSRPALRRNYAFFSRLQAWAGLPARPRTATFAGRAIVPSTQEKPPFWRWNHAGNALLFSSYHLSPATIPAYAEMLARFRPELIDTYPSSIEPIARWLVSNRLADIRPRAVITSSETLSPEARGSIEAAFGCKVHDHYGAAEMAAFVSQCDRGSYHPNPEFGVVEILNGDRPAAPGEVGEIVATGFINPVMPLIRYATGDSAIPGSGSCSCGRAFPVLASIEGRRDDVLVTPEGRLVGRLDPVFKKVGSFSETRIVQDDLDHVRVEVVQDGDVSPVDASVLLHELRNRLGPRMRIDIVAVGAIPRTAGGKFRSVVNLVTRQAGGEARPR